MGKKVEATAGFGVEGVRRMEEWNRTWKLLHSLGGRIAGRKWRNANAHGSYP